MINLLNISKSYGETQAINSINLTIDTSKTTVLIGPSGCGKSSILRTVIGLITPDSGDINLDGNNLNTTNLILQRRTH